MINEKDFDDIVPERICPDVSSLATAIAEYNTRARALRELMSFAKIRPFYELKTFPNVFERFVSDLLNVRPNIYQQDANNDGAALDNLKHVLNKYDKFYVYVLKELGSLKYKFMLETILGLDAFSYQVNHFVIKGNMSINTVNYLRKIRKHCDFLKNQFGPQFSKCWTGDMPKTQAFEIANYARKNDIFIDIVYLSKLVDWFKRLQEKTKRDLIKGKKEKIYTRSRHTEKQQLSKYLDAKAEVFQLEKEIKGQIDSKIY